MSKFLTIHSQYSRAYSDTLLHREQQLWDRQSQMMESILHEAREAQQALRSQLIEDRASWRAREEQLLSENALLREKLFIALQRIDSLTQNVSAVLRVQTDDHQHVVDGTAAIAELPGPMERREASPSNTPTPPSTTPQALRWGAEIRAAMAAVDEVDILTSDPDFLTLSSEGPSQLYADGGEDGDGATVPSMSSSPDGGVALPSGPPPELSVGADDIFWVNQLHTTLVDAGYYPGDEDIDDFYFGDSTLAAISTLQACNGLPETGFVDMVTWELLLGPSLQPKQSHDLSEDMAMAGSPHAQQETQKKAFVELFESTVENTTTVDAQGNVTAASSQVRVHDSAVSPTGGRVDDDLQWSAEATRSETGVVIRSSVSTSHQERRVASVPTKWPVLIEGDGGREVHALHVGLEKAGFSAGEDDTQWWQFGDTTMNALKTFQACSGLPESGVCDERTWKALLGEAAVPSDLVALHSGESDDEDLADDGGGTRVWLIGEQRWEDRSKLKRDGE